MTERYRLALVREPALSPIGAAVHRPADLAGFADELLRHEAQEVVICLHLDRSHRIRGYQEISRGGLDSALVDLRVLFSGVLLSGASAFALAHNHPSGEPTPSPDDLALTARIAKAAELLGLEFLDHLLIASGRWASLRETTPW